MELHSITPLVLTFNEQENIDRCLNNLSWAKTVVVVDSESSDQTVDQIKRFPNASVASRRFTNHTDQWNYGLSRVASEWVLTLDADYVVTEELVDELKALQPNHDVYEAAFAYCVHGKALRASLFPPRALLFRPAKFSYRADGHTQLLDTSNTEVGKLRTQILHDDRKPLSRWVNSQLKYAELEASKLASTPHAQLGWKDRLRTKYVLAPILTVFYCLFVRGLILDGWPGIYYTMQRVFAELTLSMVLLDSKLRNGH